MNWGDPRLSNAFWRNVSPEPNSGCWLWTGSLTNGGYGKFGHGSKLAHRVAYSAVHWLPTDGIVLDHEKCDTRCCVNPAHLRPKTTRANILRSETAPAAINARKAMCKRGHALAADNLVPAKLKHGERACLVCFRAYDREAKRKRRARRKAS